MKRLKNASAQLGDFLATYDSEIVPNFNTAIERTKRMSKNTSQILKRSRQKASRCKKNY